MTAAVFAFGSFIAYRVITALAFYSPLPMLSAALSGICSGILFFYFEPHITISFGIRRIIKERNIPMVAPGAKPWRALLFMALSNAVCLILIAYGFSEVFANRNMDEASEVAGLGLISLIPIGATYVYAYKVADSVYRKSLDKANRSSKSRI